MASDDKHVFSGGALGSYLDDIRAIPLLDEQDEIAVKYEGYIKRQLEQVERFREQEEIEIPIDIDYSKIQSISTEVREKLNKIRPRSLGQAGRIQGVTPAAIAVIHIYLRKKYHA